MVIPYNLVEEGHPIEMISDLMDRVWNIMLLVWAFKFRNRMNTQLASTPGQQNWFHGAWVFLFEFLYINFKINKLNETNTEPAH
jgi:hypothetical protein